MLTEKSYARITLALDILKKLKGGDLEGYHKLNIIKHQIDLYDTISIEEADKTEIICNNSHVPKDNTNLCWKAADLLKHECKINKNIKITLEKNIPIQGGLAGGSSNAAITLLLLNQLWNLNLTEQQLLGFAQKVGMDVPYCIIGNTAFDTESTGILNNINTKLNLNFIIILPEFGVSTTDAYKNIDYNYITKFNHKTQAMKEAIQNNTKEDVIKNMHNDFELSVFSK